MLLEKLDPRPTPELAAYAVTPHFGFSKEVNFNTKTLHLIWASSAKAGSMLVSLWGLDRHRLD